MEKWKKVDLKEPSWKEANSIIKGACGYVHTVPDSETERRRKCTGQGFCSH